MTIASNFIPQTKLIFTRTSDGMGGFTKTQTRVEKIYGMVEVWENEPTMIVHRETNLVPEDMVIVTDQVHGSTFSGTYEVTGVRAMGASLFKRVVLSKVNRPTHPVAS